MNGRRRQRRRRERRVQTQVDAEMVAVCTDLERLERMKAARNQMLYEQLVYQALVERQGSTLQ